MVQWLKVVIMSLYPEYWKSKSDEIGPESLGKNQS